MRQHYAFALLTTAALVPIGAAARTPAPVEKLSPDQLEPVDVGSSKGTRLQLGLERVAALAAAGRMVGPDVLRRALPLGNSAATGEARRS